MNDTQATIDGFLDNRFRVVQPHNTGHRAGLDAVLLAACVDVPPGSRVADFGAGCGVAGMAIATRLRDVRVDLVERDRHMAAFARQSVALSDNAALAPRLSVIEANITGRGAEREKAGLPRNAYDHIIANPPYNSRHFQASPDRARASAHVAPPTLEPWLKAAAASLKAAGQVTFILRPQALAELPEALGRRFATLRVRAVHPRADQAAARILVRATKGTRAPLVLLPPLVLHEQDGRWRGEIEAVLRGAAAIAL